MGGDAREGGITQIASRKDEERNASEFSSALLRTVLLGYIASMLIDTIGIVDRVCDR
jgi:hypothetical protein